MLTFSECRIMFLFALETDRLTESSPASVFSLIILTSSCSSFSLTLFTWGRIEEFLDIVGLLEVCSIYSRDVRSFELLLLLKSRSASSIVDPLTIRTISLSIRAVTRLASIISSPGLFFFLLPAVCAAGSPGVKVYHSLESRTEKEQTQQQQQQQQQRQNLFMTSSCCRSRAAVTHGTSSTCWETKRAAWWAAAAAVAAAATSKMLLYGSRCNSWSLSRKKGDCVEQRRKEEIDVQGWVTCIIEQSFPLAIICVLFIYFFISICSLAIAISNTHII